MELAQLSRMSKRSVVFLVCGLLFMGATVSYGAVGAPISVPEPATGLLLVSGVGACWAALRGRMKKR